MENQVEIWRPTIVVGYEVSSEGRVRSVDREIVRSTGVIERRKGKVLAPRNNQNGYLKVCLGARHETYVHRLVCIAFHGDPPTPAHQADHINAVRSDNRAHNLRWITREENLSGRKFARGAAFSHAVLTAEKAEYILRTRGKKTSAAVARELGVQPGLVRKVRMRLTWRHVVV